MRLRSVVIAVVLVAALILVARARTLRYRFRLRHPGFAERTERIAEHAAAVIAMCSAAAVLVAALPFAGVAVRALAAGLALGLVTGIPFALDRRALRRRLRGLPEPHLSELGDTRVTTLAETGVALCRRGRFGEGVRLLQRAATLAPDDTATQRALVWGLATAGRLREAATVLDHLEGRGGTAPADPR